MVCGLPPTHTFVTGLDLHSDSLLLLKLLPSCTHTQQQKQAFQSEQHAIEALGLSKVSQQSAFSTVLLGEGLH